MNKGQQAIKDTHSIVEIGTHHVTENDCTTIELMCEQNVIAANTPLCVANLGVGFIIVLPHDEHDRELKNRQADCEVVGHELSSSFWKMCRFAQSEGHSYIRLDRDVGTVIPELDVHDWQ